MSSGFNSKTDIAGLIENIQTLTAQRGNGLKRAVLVEDLANLGLANVTTGRGGNASITPGIDLGNGTGGVKIKNPTTPQHLKIDSAFSFVVLSWDKPGYTGHATTEIWRSPTNNLSDAVMVGSTTANIYPDSQSTGTTGFYYWVRFVNKNDKQGSFNGVDGTFGKTDPDAAQNLVADRVVAGIEIVTPLLRSATIDNGAFQVDSNGNMDIGDLFSISSSGQIDIRSYAGTGGGGMQIRNNIIIVRDDNNVIRIGLGDLSQI